MRYAVFISILLLVAAVTPSHHELSEQPNIILFLVDDMGWQDTSVPFHTTATPLNQTYHTPNMERLAQQGVVFTNAYAASPVCTPTRTSIMTGQHPARTRITNWTLRNSRAAQETGPKHYPLQSPDWRFEGLQPDDVTLPALLNAAGYRTIHAGKAHWGAMETPGADPRNLGYDVNIAGHAAGAPGSYYGEHNFSASFRGRNGVWDVPGLEAYHQRDINLTEVLTIEANRAIEEAVEAKQPFFLHVAHYGVHTPIMADSQYVARYPHLDEREAAYASMIEAMDASLGGLLHQLEALDVARNTLIIFFSDNGGLSAHARGITSAGLGKNMHNLPLRSGKGSAYEGGTRVPMLLSWARPDGRASSQQQVPLEEGSRIDVPVISDDLFPTMLAFAGTEVPVNHAVDGTSLIPLLQGGEFMDRVLGWHYPHKWGPFADGTDPFTSIRKDNWKLIYFYRDQRFELYNLAVDLSETADQRWNEPEVFEDMKKALRDWMKHMDAQRPEIRSTGEVVAMP